MAAPETGDTSVSVAGTWVTIQVGIPDAFADLLAPIQGLLQALITVLNVVLAILSVVKAFLVGLLNPILAIINAIITEIENLLQDIRNIGIYMSGDFVLEPDFEDLLGGYQAYERRMIARLIDRTDPSRPQFTSSSGVISIFLYVSADTTSIMALVQMVQKLLNFFGKTTPVRAYTTPTALNVSYGIEGSSLASFGGMIRATATGDVPNAANLRWQMSPSPKGTTVKYPSLAPKGFLIEVSTIRDGLLVAYDVPISNKQPNTQNRIYGLVRNPQTGLPFRLYGGSNIIDIADLATASEDWSKEATSASRIYAFRNAADNTPIPISMLQDGSGSTARYLLQRTFFVDSGFFDTVGPGQGFAATLIGSDMPYESAFTQSGTGITVEVEAKPATTVYVRVSAVTESVADAAKTVVTKPDGPLTGPVPFWTVISAAALSAAVQNFGTFTLRTEPYSPGDKSEASLPLTVTFPAATTKEYLDTVAVALAVMVLSRSDLAAVGSLTGTDPGITSEDATSALSAAEAALSQAQASLTTAQEALAAGEASKAAWAAAGVDEETINIQIATLTAAVTSAEASVTAAETALTTASANLTAATDYASSLPTFELGKGRLQTGMEDLGRYLMPLIFGKPKGIMNYFFKTTKPPENFRIDLLRKCRALANEMYARSGPLGGLESLITEAGAVLTTFKWSDVDPTLPALNILDSLKSDDTSQGIGLNPYSIGIPSLMVVEEVFSVDKNIPRLPGFIPFEPDGSEDLYYIPGRGSADSSPVVYQRSGTVNVQFCRNVLLNSEVSVLGAAATVLNVAAAPMILPATSTGNWEVLRLFPQGLPPLEAALAQIIAFIKTIAQGLQGIVDIIVAYIEFLEARIREFQSLIQRIIGLLDLLLSFDLPPMSALVVTANGTDGILSALVTAENKPSDGTTSYGAGVVLLAGGLPSLLVAILQSFFPEE